MYIYVTFRNSRRQGATIQHRSQGRYLQEKWAALDGISYCYLNTHVDDYITQVAHAAADQGKANKQGDFSSVQRSQ